MVLPAALPSAALPARLGAHKAVAAVVAVNAWRFSEKVHVQLFLWRVSTFYLTSTRNKRLMATSKSL